MFYNLGTLFHLHGSKTHAAYSTEFFHLLMSSAPVFGNYQDYYNKTHPQAQKL